MGAGKSVYLEYYDSARNADKFYQATLKDSSVCYQWGRCGTKGQAKVETHSSERAASQALDEKVSEKARKGYSRTGGSVPLPQEFSQAASPPPKKEPETNPDQDSEPASYFLNWKAARPIDAAALEESAELTRRIIDHCQHLLPQRFLLQSGEDYRQVLFFEDGEQVAAFGYPPMAFLDALTTRERKAVLELGTSRDGWLSNHGTGQGIISTGKKMFDFPVRLFLSILAGSHGLEVSCSDGLEYGTGLAVTPTMEDFEWYPLWTELKPLVEAHWFVQGSTKVLYSAPPTEGERTYAW